MLKFKVVGMTCEHCASAVARAVRQLPDVRAVEVSLARGEVTIDGAPSRDAVRAAIEEEGYELADGP